MSKKVLLLGGAGFIGFNIAKYLSENRDYQLTIADNFARGKEDELFTALVKKHHIKVIAGDYTDPRAFDQLEDNYDQVYMLASVVGVDNANSIPHEIIRINTALIYNTLEWIRRSKIGKVLFTSTSECYAGTIEAFGYTTPTPEEAPGDPLASLLVIGGMLLLCFASMWSLSRKQKKAETRQNEHLNRVEEGRRAAFS